MNADINLYGKECATQLFNRFLLIFGSAKNKQILLIGILLLHVVNKSWLTLLLVVNVIYVIVIRVEIIKGKMDRYKRPA